MGKEVDTCHPECEFYKECQHSTPCPLIENFNLATGRRVMKRTIPLWRARVAEQGDEKGSVEWARDELERYHCPSCGKPLFRGAQHCRACNKSVAGELDGSL